MCRKRPAVIGFIMTNKELFNKFCENVYVSIYSQPWWLDAIIGPDNWDVWIYEKGGNVFAAMPYYLQKRPDMTRITKPPLTQTNGLVINYRECSDHPCKRAQFEEEICEAAIEFIEGLGLDLYEQRFQYKFTNFLPFFWHRYAVQPRVTYVIEDTSDLEIVYAGITNKYRRNIKKGQKNAARIDSIDPETFYTEHEKIFAKQNLPVPFTRDQWLSLYAAALAHDRGKAIAAYDEEDHVMSVLFLCWDDESLYLDAGGPMPEYARFETYEALVYEGITLAHEKGLKFDFEGSVVKQINHSFREYGGRPVEYFGLRKVFNPDIILKEAQEQIALIQRDN